MLDTLIDLDTQLFLVLNNLGQPQWDSFWRAISGVQIWFPFYALLLFILGRYFQWKGFFLLVLFIVLNVVATDQGSVQLFKEQFMRLRPCHVEQLQDQMRLVKKGCGGKYGFISSHASNTFGLALFFGLTMRHKFKWVIYIMVAWASLVSYSRIYLGVHYPADILAGALYGAFCGTFFYRILFSYFTPKLRS